MFLMSKLTLDGAIKSASKMLDRATNEQVKSDIATVHSLLSNGQINEAYNFVNYKQQSDLEYLMPDNLWSFLINNQHIGKQK